MKIHPHIQIQAQIDLSDLMYGAGGVDADNWEKVDRALCKIRSLNDICLNHCCWVCINVQATTWKGAQAEVERVHAKVIRVVSRFRKVQL